MDIDKLISEYNNFIKNYEKGEMFKIRNTMRQLSHIIVSKLINNVHIFDNQFYYLFMKRNIGHTIDSLL